MRVGGGAWGARVGARSGGEGAPPPLFTRSGLFRKASQPAVQFQIRIRVGDGVCTVLHLQFNLICVISRPHQVVFLILLADPNVSRNHAEVRPSGDGFEVVDQGSTNGTKVNGVRVAEHQLRPGDEIRLGNTVLRFEAS